MALFPVIMLILKISGIDDLHYSKEDYKRAFKGKHQKTLDEIFTKVLHHL